MKHTNNICALFFMLISMGAAAGYTQTPDSLGLPGDNLNLYGVLTLFKESQNVEEFEKKLNTPDNKVNNLDLNNDGKIDYIRVKDYGENGIHSLVLQDPITATETQDLAIIEIEQQGNNNVHVQIVGDEDLYGKNYIIEPQDQQQTQVNDNTYNQAAPVMVNVWAWPCVGFIYGPSYVYWNSPWYWGYYPSWWSPWSPIGYYAYWNGMYPYRVYHHRVYANRIMVAQNIYYKHRQVSPTVRSNIERQVYYGPRTNGKINGQPTKNNNVAGLRGKETGKTPQSNSKAMAAVPKQQTKVKQSINGQQKQNVAPRQQQIPKQNQEIPKQQPTQPRMQQQEMPRQTQMAPHMSGGGHMGGGGGGRRR